jgi:hypothetical protein
MSKWMLGLLHDGRVTRRGGDVVETPARRFMAPNSDTSSNEFRIVLEPTAVLLALRQQTLPPSTPPDRAIARNFDRATFLPP